MAAKPGFLQSWESLLLEPREEQSDSEKAKGSCSPRPGWSQRSRFKPQLCQELLVSFRQTQASVCLTLKWVDYKFLMVCAP